MSDHSDDYDMQINGQVDGLVGADDTPPVDSKGAEHEHKFVIPVEWRFNYWGRSGSNMSSASQPSPQTKVVTKLRCECGKEEERQTNE